MFRKVIVLFFVVTILFSYSAQVNTVNAFEVTPCWTLIANVANGMSIDSNGKASMVSSINAYDGVERVRISAFLQRYQNGAWVTVNSWTEDYDGNRALWIKNWYVSSGYNYRLTTFFYAYQGGSQESTYLISGTQYY